MYQPNLVRVIRVVKSFTCIRSILLRLWRKYNTKSLACKRLEAEGRSVVEAPINVEHKERLIVCRMPRF